jgi:hypothetical protein
VKVTLAVAVCVGVREGVKVLVGVRVFVGVGAVRLAVPLTTQTLSKVRVAVNDPSSPRLEGTPPNWTRNELVAPAPRGIDGAAALVGDVESFPL